MVLMSIDTFERREQLLELREKVLQAEEERLSGAKTKSVSEARKALEERLEQFPGSGALTPDAWLNARGYRMVICGKHAAIYRVIGRSVLVYHIADTQTNYTKLFF